jgi:hypothetical protein
MKSTEAKPGKPIVMKLREDEEPQIMDWLNLQGMYSDSIRYLIQKEIAENGLRNLQLYVPQARTIDTIKAQMASLQVHIPNHNALAPSLYITTPPPSTMNRESAISQVVNNLSPTDTANSQSERDMKANPVYDESAQSSAENDAQNKDETSKTEVVTSDGSEQGHSDKEASTSPGAPKRKAAKTFGKDIANSYAN